LKAVSISDNLRSVHERIQKAAEHSGRNPGTIRLVAVSKTQPASAVLEAFTAGQPIFGENYAQEFRDKCSQLPAGIEWHFIGSLQTNKVKYLAGMTKLIHSVDRISLARELDRQWEKTGQKCNILLQVNISGEETKTGTTASEVMHLAREAAQLQNLSIRGLMTMPPFFDQPELARPFFRDLRRLSLLIAEENIPGVSMDELSMGMSGDFEVAIEEGATLVRVGFAIFGERHY
jgi:pyridoxal phosphate enzyme (YggS family)